MKEVVLQLAGIEPGSELGAVVAKRADIFELTQETHDAALRPAEPGGLSHGFRAAIACRIARLNRDAAFTEYFDEALDLAQPTEVERRASDLGFAGSDERTRALIRHADLLAANPKNASGSDIEALVRAGVSEPDIVRLSELVAFLSYEIRVVAGLRLMRRSA